MKKLMTASCLVLTGAVTAAAPAPALAASPALTQAAASPAAATVRAGTAAKNCQTRSIKSLANGRYVSAEFGWSGSDSGMLRARATKVGPWEKFVICYGTSYHTIMSWQRSRYVAAELGNKGDRYGMLRARTFTLNEPGPWERFWIASCGKGCVTIRRLNVWSFVSAELGHTGDKYGMLRARAREIGPWEKFSIQ